MKNLDKRASAIVRCCGLLLLVVPISCFAEDNVISPDPGMWRARIRQFEFLTDHAVTEDCILVYATHIEDVFTRLHNQLHVPRVTQPVKVFIFAEHQAFSSFTTRHIPSVRYGDTIRRRAMFLLREGQPYIFVAQSNETLRSLRHESVHVALNLAHPDLPIWIDEGLAMNYESPDGNSWNEGAVARLTQDFWRVHVPGVDALEKNVYMADLTSLEYAACWANIHVLISSAQGQTNLSNWLESLRQKSVKTPTSHLSGASRKLGFLSRTRQQDPAGHSLETPRIRIHSLQAPKQ